MTLLSRLKAETTLGQAVALVGMLLLAGGFMMLFGDVVEVLKFYLEDTRRITLEVVGIFTVLNSVVLSLFLLLWTFSNLADVMTLVGRFIDYMREGDAEA